MLFAQSSTEVAFFVRLDLAFNNVKPNDWYFVLDLVRVRTELGYVCKTNKPKFLAGWIKGSWSPATLLLKVRVD